MGEDKLKHTQIVKMKEESRSNKALIHEAKEGRKNRTLLGAENNRGVTGNDTETQIFPFVP